jgi:hypothetical protein
MHIEEAYNTILEMYNFKIKIFDLSVGFEIF